MRRGTCVKCGASPVRAARNGIASNGSHTSVRPHVEEGFRGIVQPHNGEAWQFACTRCGYLEWWVLDAATVQHIEQTWLTVTPPEGDR